MARAGRSSPTGTRPTKPSLIRSSMTSLRSTPRRRRSSPATVRKKAELPTLEKVLHDRGLMEWDVDFSADDWHPISSERVVELALKRIEERGRGILLLHDIHQHTVDALPVLQRELKARGYRIVE